METVPKTTKSRGGKTMLRIISTLVIGLFVAISGASAFAASPPISWEPSSIDVNIDLGGTPVYVSVDVTSDIDLGGLEVFIVPELRPFVTVTPISVGGGTAILEFTISAESFESAGIYDGTIHLRDGSKTIAKPLSVVVHVGEEIGVGGGTFTSDDEQATLVIPQGAISGEPLIFSVDEISIDDFLFPPTWGTPMGTAYDFGPEGAVFDKPLELTVQYVPEDIPAGSFEEDLRIAYEKLNGDVVGLDDCVVNTTADTITCSVWHFTRFMIIINNDNALPGDPSNVFIEWLNFGTPEVDLSVGVLEWDNPTDADFSHVIIFKSSTGLVLGEVFLPEVKEVCGTNEAGCIEGPNLEIQLDLGQNCFMVRAVDKAGNVSDTATLSDLQSGQRCIPGL